ncbi:hypothetical protein [Calothrix sp. UHCC 0171]|uniref:hypothetical protein n=1 Tax=Calothrix sp. UHCC 0171 TaxID=3110245 RepID=UPI002B1F6B68|nr:hypothetical protein [Calothrix sp. UHCC 0171]MEA5571655.1 hypothetical protein [Calothrix sp. UHCC 0171]
MLKNKYTLWISLLVVAAVAFGGGMLTEYLYRTPGNAKPLTVYGTDEQASAVQTDLYVSFDSKLNQTQQLEKLSTLISRYKFCDLPIEIKSIKDGIATVNLDEHPWVKAGNTPPSIPGCSGKSWRYGYFQGSAGGYATTATLTRTFVQPNYQGNWIKGVQFYYAGKPIQDGDWDHIQLDGVITSQNLP